MNEQIYISVRLNDGSVAILGFLTKGRGTVLPSGAIWDPANNGYWLRPASDVSIAEEVWRAFSSPLGAQPIAWRVVQLAEIPTDRTYRGAWHDNGVALGHDMVKARALHLEKLRRARANQLAALDADWMRATGQRDVAEANRIEAERQALRDMPARVAPLLAAAQDIEQLKLVA